MTYPIPHESPNTKKVDTQANYPDDRDTFVSEIREKLNKVQSKITTMRDEGSRLAGDLKKKADENLAKLDTKHKELTTKLEEFKNSTEANWKADKEVLQKSFQDLSMNFKGLFN